MLYFWVGQSSPALPSDLGPSRNMTLFSIYFVTKDYMIVIKFKISNSRKFHQSFGRISGKICQSGAQRDRINVTRPETMQIRQKSRSLTEISGSCHCLWILNCDFIKFDGTHGIYITTVDLVLFRGLLNRMLSPIQRQVMKSSEAVCFSNWKS